MVSSRKKEKSLSILHHKIWVFEKPLSPQQQEWASCGVAVSAVLPARWQCCTELSERGSQQCRALLSIPGWALLSICSIIYSRSSCDNLKNGSTQLKTCLHYSVCCVKAGLCLPCVDEFFVTMLYSCISPWGDKALQGRTIFGDYISSVWQANPAQIDMGFICLALCMQHKNLRQLQIELREFYRKKTSSQLVQEGTWEMSSVFVN